MQASSRAFLLVFACLVAGCSSGTSDAVAEPARLVLSANTTVVEPDRTAPVPALDYARFGGDALGGVYRVTTPAGVPFAFDLVAWGEGATGAAQVSVGHAGDGGQRPFGGVESMAAAGLAPSGMGLSGDEDWLTASGDGFARLTVQGVIEREQVLLVRSHVGGTAVVVIAIGEPSLINQIERTVPPHPAVASRATIHTSDAWSFGLPTVAVSGDRTTVVAYDGDQHLGMLPNRYELRMQHDRVTGAVTGGGSVASSADSGNWRDHEIAALHNVLAVVRGEGATVRVRLSYDRGAAFGQEVVLGGNAGQGFASQTRLVQAAMALDYTLAVVYWQPVASGAAIDLMLSEGRPVSFDGNGSPTWFQFEAPQRLHTMPGSGSPLLTGVAWSEGGDLVIGYGYSAWAIGAGLWGSTTEFRCATRRYAEPIHDVLVDREVMVGYDPSVALLGQGASLRVFYAYEVRAGVRLATSDDGGRTFARIEPFGGRGSHNPTVFARQQGADTRVDVLYLANQPLGRELHHSRWLAWPLSGREDFRLTAAQMQPTPYHPGRQTATGYSAPLTFGLRLTQVNWLGYDAVLDGSQIVAVYDEETRDAAFTCLGLFRTPGGTVPNGTVLSPTFRSASPPPLAPGMTQPMPPQNPAHAHQLQLVRID